MTGLWTVIAACPVCSAGLVMAETERAYPNTWFVCANCSSRTLVDEAIPIRTIGDVLDR